MNAAQAHGLQREIAGISHSIVPPISQATALVRRICRQKKATHPNLSQKIDGCSIPVSIDYCVYKDRVF